MHHSLMLSFSQLLYVTPGGTIELIKHNFFSVDNKFEAIVNNVQVPVSNKYL